MGNGMLISIDQMKELDQVVDSQLEKDAFYQAKATPLKPAGVWKAEHREQLRNAYQFKEFLEKIRLGFRMIDTLLPSLIGIQAYTQVIEEYVSNREHVNKQVLENQKLTIQEEWDISDATMHNLYLLAKQLLDEKRFKESDAVFTVLSYLNPKVPEYTLGASIALYAMGDYEAAAELLQLTKILQPNHPAPFVYSALCHQKLNNAQKYAEDRARVDELLAQSDQARKDWEPYLKLFASKREV